MYYENTNVSHRREGTNNVCYTGLDFQITVMESQNLHITRRLVLELVERVECIEHLFLSSFIAQKEAVPVITSFDLADREIIETPALSALALTVYPHHFLQISH